MITLSLIKFIGTWVACLAIGWLLGISGTHKENGVLK